jgi:RNA polymerase sigma-70 factor (ECF subfamily)
MQPPREGPIDPAAFAGLVEEYADRLYSLAVRITGSAEDARDAVQDTFLSAYRQRAQFRAEADLGTWLYRIAVNAALQRVRARRPVEYLDDTGYDRTHIVDWSDDLARRAEIGELRLIIEQGIARLPDEARVALVLRDVEGLSTAEAADILEISETALKSRLHRARLLLRQYLADYLEDR